MKEEKEKTQLDRIEESIEDLDKCLFCYTLILIIFIGVGIYMLITK